MHEVLVNGLGGLSLSRKSVVRLTDRPDMTLDVYRGRKTTMQQQHVAFCQYLADHVLLPPKGIYYHQILNLITNSLHCIFFGQPGTMSILGSFCNCLSLFENQSVSIYI